VVCLVNQNAEICEKEEEVKRSSDPKCENGGVIEAPMEKKILLLASTKSKSHSMSRIQSCAISR
jgi:hypothetical protein